MERLPKSHEEKLPPLSLFLDDIEEVVKIMKEVTDQEVILTTDEYQLNDVSELKSLPHQRLNTLTVETCTTPVIVLTLLPQTASLQISDSTTLSLGVFERIKRLMYRRRRRLAQIAAFEPVRSISIIVAIISLLFIADPASRPSVRAWVLFLFLIVTLLALFSVHVSKSYSLVILSRTGSHESFWTRNKDKILVAIITAFLTIILTLLSQIVLSSLIR